MNYGLEFVNPVGLGGGWRECSRVGCKNEHVVEQPCPGYLEMWNGMIKTRGGGIAPAWREILTEVEHGVGGESCYNKTNTCKRLDMFKPNPQPLARYVRKPLLECLKLQNQVTHLPQPPPNHCVLDRCAKARKHQRTRNLASRES